MNQFGERYVVDTNVLTHLKLYRRASPFFQEHAVIPTEVLHEAGGFPDIVALEKNEYAITAEVLDWVVKVMATVPAEDTTLVDLYANRGGADPTVVACALDGQTKDSRFLDAPEWVVVTGDDAVRNKSQEFGLKVLSGAELAAIVDAAEDTVALRSEP